MIYFREKPLEIIENGSNYFKFSYDGEDIIISKTPIIDNPYIKTWDGFEEDEMVIAYDGYAESDKGYHIDYPTLEEIFSNVEFLENALYYRIEHEDLHWYDHILKGLNLWDIYEGFYFGGTPIINK